MANPPSSSTGLFPDPPLDGDPTWVAWAQDITEKMGQLFVTLTVPGVVTNVSATANATTIFIQWNALPGVSLYRVYRNTTGSFASATVIQNVAASKTGISIMTTQDSADTTTSSRYYWIQGVNERGAAGPQSQMVTISRTAPAPLTLTETVTMLAASSTDTVIAIPAGATVTGVSALVTVEVPGAIALRVASTSSPQTQWIPTMGVTVGSYDPGTGSGSIFYSSGSTIRIFPSALPINTDGRVQIVITYTI